MQVANDSEGNYILSLFESTMKRCCGTKAADGTEYLDSNDSVYVKGIEYLITLNKCEEVGRAGKRLIAKFK